MAACGFLSACARRGLPGGQPAHVMAKGWKEE